MVDPEPNLDANMEHAELVVPLGNGGAVHSGWIDTDDPDAQAFGDYLSVVDDVGRQLFYIDAADLFAAPNKGRAELARFLKACLGHDQMRDLQA